MRNLTLQKISVAGLLICTAILLGAAYIEMYYYLPPCPLCTLQRIFFGMLALIFLLGSMINWHKAYRYLYTLLILLFASTGFLIALRQFWLQYFAPPQQISCGASLSRLMEIYPFFTAIKAALAGGTICSKVDFTILTMSLAGWSVILFGIFVIGTIYILYLQKKRRL